MTLRVLLMGMIMAGPLACASLNYVPRIQTFGKYRDTTDLEARADSMTWSEAGGVDTYVAEFPAGVRLVDGTVEVSSDSGYELVAKVAASMKSGGGWAPVNLYDYPEDEAWRRRFCHWQGILMWPTLLMWGVVPTAWPCFVFETNDVDDVSARRRRIVNTLKKATLAAGGDTLIVTALGKLSTINAATGQTVGYLDMIGGEGYALKRRVDIDNR